MPSPFALYAIIPITSNGNMLACLALLSLILIPLMKNKNKNMSEYE